MTNPLYRSGLWLSLFLILAVSVMGQSPQEAKVRYVSAGAVYLDRGSNAGIKNGDRWEIIRAGATIAQIEVIYLATASSSCKIISQQKEIKAGDTARWLESTASKAAPADTSIEARTRVIPVKPDYEIPVSLQTRVSGVVSAQWYHRTDNSAAGMDFNQWNARLSMRIRNMWTPGLNLNVNTRARFDQRKYALASGPPEEEWRNRIYWIALAYEPMDAPLHFQAGRIASNKFSGLGYLDGLILQHNLSKSFYWGIFGGIQPDMRSADFSTDMQKYGVYGTYHTGTYSDRYLSTTLAMAGSYQDGKVNREYAYLEFRMTDPTGWRVTSNMEIDYNRDWRKNYDVSTFALTSFWFSGSWRFNDWLTAGLGYDNRRNYLTYVYYSRAQEIFNEAQRQSLRAHIQVRLPATISLSLRGGARKGKDDPDISHNYGISLIKSDLVIKQIQGSLTFNGFRTLYNRGISPAVSVRYFNGGLSGSTGYGAYRYTLLSNQDTRLNQYVNVSVSLPVWNRIYLFGHYYYDWGDDMQGHRVLTELGYRL